MDSEHRHELKTNELAQFLSHLPDFLKKNARTIIGIILIAAAVFIYFYQKERKTSTTNIAQAKNTALMQQITKNKFDALNLDPETAPLENAFVTSADQLQKAVDTTKESENISAMMLIKKGEALRSELHFSTSKLDDQLITEQIERATAAYEQALQKAKGNTTLTAMATFGLGLCAEELGDFEKAEQTYSDIAQNPEFKATVFPTQAQFRLDIIEDNKKTFEFVQAPKIQLPEGMDESLRKAIESGQIQMQKVEPPAETATEAEPEINEKPADTKEKEE